MTEEQAAQLVGVLIAATTGWNDDSADATIQLISARWDNPDAGITAVEHVIETWERPSRPTWGVLSAAYRSELHRRALERPALTPSTGIPVPVPEGRQIAARAYAEQCRETGRTPNQRLLDGFLGVIPDTGTEDDPSPQVAQFEPPESEFTPETF